MPEALLVHDGPGRLRLRLPALRGAGEALAALALAAAALPGVAAAQAAHLTGSLLILHRGRSEEILEAAQARGLFTLRAAPAAPPAIPPGALLPAAGAAGAAALALVQLLRREALPPALTLACHAVLLARQAWAGMPAAAGAADEG